MKKVEESKLYTAKEFATKFHKEIVNMELDDIQKAYVVTDDNNFIDEVLATKKQIFSQIVVFIGSDEVFENLNMYSINNFDAEDITVEDVFNVIKDYGFVGDSYYTFDEPVR